MQGDGRSARGDRQIAWSPSYHHHHTHLGSDAAKHSTPSSVLLARPLPFQTISLGARARCGGCFVMTACRTRQALLQWPKIWCQRKCRPVGRCNTQCLSFLLLLPCATVCSTMRRNPACPSFVPAIPLLTHSSRSSSPLMSYMQYDEHSQKEGREGCSLSEKEFIKGKKVQKKPGNVMCT